MKAIEARRWREPLLKRKVSQAEDDHRRSVLRAIGWTTTQQTARANGAVGPRGEPLGRPALGIDAVRRTRRMLLQAALAAGLRPSCDNETHACADRAEFGGIRRHGDRNCRGSRFYAAEPERRRRFVAPTQQAIVQWKPGDGAEKGHATDHRLIDESDCPRSARLRVPIGAVRGQHESSTELALEAMTIAGLSWWLSILDRRGIRTAQIIEFLSALCKHIGGPLLICAATAQGLIRVERSAMARSNNIDASPSRSCQPVHAELDPVEAIWAYEEASIGDLCPTPGLLGVRRLARRRLRSMQRRPELIQASSQHPDLALYVVDHLPEARSDPGPETITSGLAAEKSANSSDRFVAFPTTFVAGFRRLD